jgi:hypothetical protein
LCKLFPNITDTGIRFTLFAIAGDDAAVYDLSHNMLSLRGDFEDPATWWPARLKRDCPAVYKELKDMHADWGKAVDRFKAIMPTASQTASFGKQCRPCKHKPYAEYMRNEGAFRSFRGQLIKKVSVDVVAGRLLMDPLGVVPSVACYAQAKRLALSCRRCTNRLGRDLVRVLVYYWSGTVSSPADRSAWRIGKKT